MKTKFLLFGAVAAMTSLASCSSSATDTTTDADSTAVAVEKVYSGVVPAADAAGIRYTVTLTTDSTNTDTGSYNLVEAVLKGDGVSDSTEIKTTGAFVVESKDGKSYLKLMPEATDSTALPIYFYIASDSTIVMVNADLQESANHELNYTLNIQK